MYVYIARAERVRAPHAKHVAEKSCCILSLSLSLSLCPLSLSL